MTLHERLDELVRAAFSGVWVVTREPDDAEAEIAKLCRDRGWAMARWDVDAGLRAGDAAHPDAPDPVAALRALPTLGDPDGTAILVLRNVHRFLGSAEVVQALEAALSRGRTLRRFVVALSPVLQLPPELERQFVAVDHELPDREQLEAIARSVADGPGELPSEGPELEAVLEAAGGLTRLEAEGAFALSLVRRGRVEPGPLWEVKAGTLRQAGALSLHRGGGRLDALGGLDALKSFCLRALAPRAVANRPRARGVLLLGVPGTGKSAFCRALGAEVGRPTLVLDVGALKGSLVGQTEERTRQALALVDRMSPSVAMVDEVEKALAGVEASGRTDSGVTAGMFGTLLTWLSDRTSDAFVVCTCNDITALPPEFARAERFDAVYFLDLPGDAERESIWRLHLAAYGLDRNQRRPDDRGWTGAEVASCCRLAALLGVPLAEAAANVVPVSVTAAEKVERLRQWAAGRCLDATRGGTYRGPQESRGAARRQVRRGDPTPN